MSYHEQTMAIAERRSDLLARYDPDVPLDQQDFTEDERRFIRQATAPGITCGDWLKLTWPPQAEDQE
jgi:hypothetical protein